MSLEYAAYRAMQRPTIVHIVRNSLYSNCHFSSFVSATRELTSHYNKTSSNAYASGFRDCARSPWSIGNRVCGADVERVKL
jgi:hypothetical protein